MNARQPAEPVRQRPVDLIILCGFLGSGKTTLLVDFLKQEAGMHDTAVIVNEAGEVGIDGALVTESGDDIPMTLLANGCVCCSLRSSLIHTVSRLLDAPRPAGAPPLARIVIETSGLSRPGPIIASLTDPDLAQRGLRVSVVSTYDAVLGGLRTDEFDEAAAQLAAAQRIVLTKLDLIAPDALVTRIAQATLVNPMARVLSQTDRQLQVRQAFAFQADEMTDHANILSLIQNATPLASSHPRIHVMKGTVKPGTDWEELSIWLDNLAGLCGERLLRVKALVHVTDCEDPILIQSVGTTFSIPRRMTQRRDAPDVIVIITRDISPDEIASGLAVTCVHLTALPTRDGPSIAPSLSIFNQRSSHASA